MTLAAPVPSYTGYREARPVCQPARQELHRNSAARLHRDPSVLPSVDKQAMSKEVGVSSVSIRSFIPSRNVPIKISNTAERVRFALQAWGRNKPAPIKQIQHIAEVDQKTASAWYHGKQPPRADHLLTLALHIPELKAEIRRLLQLEQDHAENFQREATALLQRYAR